tara:strand:+ start:467 stop:661 length:195 start_codon:yes stop_codon:yes gene_type:complete
MDKSTKWLIRIACLVIIGAPLGFVFQQKQANYLEEVENFYNYLIWGHLLERNLLRRSNPIWFQF